MVGALSSKRPLGWDAIGALLLLASLFLIVFLCSGCANSCFVFVSNPSSGVILIGGGASGSGCLAPIPHGMVRVTMHIAAGCEGCAAENRIRNLFLTLEGIALHSTAASEQNVGGWQELQPGISQNPIQLELDIQEMSDVSLGQPSDVPAGRYDFLRLRFARSDGNVAFQTNPCGASGLSCAQMADGRTYPLATNASLPELLISLADLPSGSLVIAPDSDNQLHIEVMPVWAVTVGGNGLQFLPSLLLHSKAGATAALSSSTAASGSDR